VFGVKGGMKGPILIPLFFIFLFIGVIEVISILIRPVALAMRLYGNIYGGENVLTLMLGMGPKWLFGLTAIPFYFLELVVAVVQALGTLTLLFALPISALRYRVRISIPAWIDAALTVVGLSLIMSLSVESSAALATKGASTNIAAVVRVTIREVLR